MSILAFKGEGGNMLYNINIDIWNPAALEIIFPHILARSVLCNIGIDFFITIETPQIW